MKTKLFYIANARIPTEKAHGLQIMEMCSAFAKKAEVTLVAPRRVNPIKQDPFLYYAKGRTFKLKKIACLDLIIFDKYLGHLGLWVESLTFLISAFFYAIFRKADIIYIRDRFLLPLSLIKKNVIFEVHTFPSNYFLYRFLFGRARKLVVITQKLKDLFAEKGIGTQKISVAPDGVDIAGFNIDVDSRRAREKLGLPQNKKIALYTGHLYEWKGADVMLGAARLLTDHLFVFVGGTEKDIVNFKKMATGMTNILIAGHKPHQEIPFWLKAADVLVLPNSGKEEISKYWTSPIKMFEYMAAKVPIVASDLPSIGEILNEGNAVLVEPDNSVALAKGIEEIMKNKTFAEQMANRAFNDVQKYTWDNRAAKILDSFRLNSQ